MTAPRDALRRLLRRAGGGHRRLHRLQIHGGAAAPQEALLVELHLGAVQLDGLHDGVEGQRDGAALPGGAQHEHVGGDAVAHQPARHGEAVHGEEALAAGPLGDAPDQFVLVHAPVGIAGEVGGRHQVARHHHGGGAGLHAGERLVVRGDHQVAADHGIGLRIGDVGGVELGGIGGDVHM